MDAGKAAKILTIMVSIGLCVAEGLKAVFLLDSAPAPNPASGHTEPALFAPVVSTSWSYITPTQIVILSVVTGAVLLLALLMFGLQLHGKWLSMRRHEDGAPREPATPQPAPRVAGSHPGQSSFGRRTPGT
jgi:hypothetical protein